MGGSSTHDGVGGSGTLIRFGNKDNNCSEVVLQFDAGRATNSALSRHGVSDRDLDAVFLTHLHADHSGGLGDILQSRWRFLGEPLDVVCSIPVATGTKKSGHTMNCKRFLAAIGDAAIAAGEIAQSRQEEPRRLPGGPSALVRLIEVDPLKAKDPVEVWRSGQVSVSAISSAHIAGHLSYRVDTPAGSVVIGGDAGREKADRNSPMSTSSQVAKLARNSDILVHSAVHPIFGPEGGSTYPTAAYRLQSTVADLGAMADESAVRQLILTHLIPAIGADSHGAYPVPGGRLTGADYEHSAKSSGFKGGVYVGEDGFTLRLCRYKSGEEVDYSTCRPGTVRVARN